MTQVFHPSANTIAKATLLGAILIIAAVVFAASGFDRSSYATNVGVPVQQPVPFSHEHHAGRLGISCQYCHTSVTKSNSAGMPATHTCMTCHSQIWVDSPMLEPVRASYRTGTPLKWNRVNDLPDFVYFNHSIHVKKGVGCTECHGQVNRMPLVWKTASLRMEWCLDCHRNPENHLRPRDEVFNMNYHAKDQQALGKRLLSEYHIYQEKMTNCSICHR
jgi:hypothetical protein